jgi:hypothetical protein
VATGIGFRRKSVGRAVDAARYGAGNELVLCSEAVIELHRTETTNYRDNLASGAPALWIALRPVVSERPYEILAVTADPAEGEALTDAGSNLVEAVSMPLDVVEAVGQFIAHSTSCRASLRQTSA